MAALTAAQRNALPKSEFAMPAKDGYPVDTAKRARSALSRVAQFGNPAEKAQVKGKVKRDYPGIKAGANGGNGPGNGRGNGNGNGRGNGRGNGSTNRQLAQRLESRLDARDRR